MIYRWSVVEICENSQQKSWHNFFFLVFSFSSIRQKKRFNDKMHANINDMHEIVQPIDLVTNFQSNASLSNISWLSWREWSERERKREKEKRCKLTEMHMKNHHEFVPFRCAIANVTLFCILNSFAFRKRNQTDTKLWKQKNTHKHRDENWQITLRKLFGRDNGKVQNILCNPFVWATKLIEKSNTKINWLFQNVLSRQNQEDNIKKRDRTEHVAHMQIYLFINELQFPVSEMPLHARNSCEQTGRLNWNRRKKNWVFNVHNGKVSCPKRIKQRTKMKLCH